MKVYQKSFGSFTQMDGSFKNLFENNIGGAESFKKNVWASVCIRKICDEMALCANKMRTFQQKNGKEIEVNDKKVLQFLDMQNSKQRISRRDLFWKISYNLMTTGECLVYIDRADNVLRVVDTFSFQTDMSGDIAYYSIQFGRRSLNALRTDILHFRLSMHDLNEINSVKKIIDADNIADIWSSNVFLNNGTPDTLILLPNGTKSEKVESIKDRWRLNFKGVARKVVEFFTGLREDGTELVKKLEIGKTQTDLSFVEISNSNAEKILACFGVPKSILGLVTDVNRANAESNRVVFFNNCIKPKLECILDTLNTFFLPQFNSDLYFKFVGIEPIDFSQEMQKDSLLITNGALTINELRAKNGLEPIENGDIPLIAFSLVPLGSEKQTIDTNTQEQKSIEKKKIDKVQLKAEHKGKMDGYEKNFISELLPFFKEQEKKVKKNLEKYFSRKSVSKEYDDSILFSPEEENSILSKIMFPLLFLFAKKETEFSAKEVEMKIPSNFFSIIQRFISKRVNFSSNSINQTTFDLLKNAVKSGIQDGLSESQISEKVSKIYSNIPKYRASTIARTEVSSAIEQSRYSLYKEAEIEKIEWVSIHDSRSRHWHESVDGVVIGIDEKFNVGGEEMKCPHDPNASAKNTINCRCRIIAKVE